MEGNVHRALIKLNHFIPKNNKIIRTRGRSHSTVTKSNTQKIPNTPPLDSAKSKIIQAIAGTFLFYSCAVDPPMIVAFNETTSQQAKLTISIIHKANILMDYAHIHLDSTIRYRASMMILHINIDAAYFVQSNARSRL